MGKPKASNVSYESLYLVPKEEYADLLTKCDSRQRRLLEEKNEGQAEHPEKNHGEEGAGSKDANFEAPLPRGRDQEKVAQEASQEHEEKGDQAGREEGGQAGQAGEEVQEVKKGDAPLKRLTKKKKKKKMRGGRNLSPILTLLELSRRS